MVDTEEDWVALVDWDTEDTLDTVWEDWDMDTEVISWVDMDMVLVDTDTDMVTEKGQQT